MKARIELMQVTPPSCTPLSGPRPDVCLADQRLRLLSGPSDVSRSGKRRVGHVSAAPPNQKLKPRGPKRCG